MIAAAHIAQTPEDYAQVWDFFKQTCTAHGLSTKGMDMEDAEDFVALGATRLGTSRIVKIAEAAEE